MTGSEHCALAENLLKHAASMLELNVAIGLAGPGHATCTQGIGADQEDGED